MNRARRSLCVLFALWAAPALGQAVSGNANHGMPGLLQTPWAYAPPDGTLSLGISSELPYVNLSTSAQVLPWFWFGARYTQVRDRLYQPDTTNDTPYLDKGFDVVFSPFKERQYMPAVSIGLLDIAGTGIFGSEYIVASKSFSMFSASLGLGWGRLGSAGDLDNPLGAVASSFKEPRDAFDPDKDQGGNLFSGNWFSGPDTALFGSLVWHSPARRWQAFIEYDGNIYDNGNTNLQRDNEPAVRRVASATRWNAGVRWRPWSGLELTAGYIRGNTATLSLRLFGDLDHARTTSYPPALTTRVRRRSDQGDTQGWDETLWANQLWVMRFTQQPSTQSARLDAVYARTEDFATDSLSIARLTFAEFPELRSLETRDVRVGMPRLQATWERGDVVAEESGKLSREELIAKADIQQAQPCFSDHCGASDENEARSLVKYPTWAYTITPALRSNIGSPARFWITDLQLKPGIRLQLATNLSLSAIGAFRIVGNLEEATPYVSSALPPVRSNLERYQTESGSAYLESLEVNYFQKLSRRVYSKVSAGILEEMFGGVFSEVVWIPYRNRLAFGVEAAWAQQRDFSQLFDFQDYNVVTGHASVYWNTGWHGIQAEITAGRYLAKDVGATLKLSRIFPSGLEIGAFATKTDVSAEDFGEGSFDKGFFFNIPLELLNRGRARDTVRFEYRFLTRDGGQKLQVNRRLIPELGFPFDN